MQQPISTINKVRGDNMFIEERHQAILEMLKQNGRISVEEIADSFNVSVESARRDLRILDEKALLKKTHGGAIPMRQIAYGKPAKATGKVTEIFPSYLEIAKKAVSLINNNDVVFLTSASVGYLMTQNIPETLRFRVVTNSIVIAEELRVKDNVSIILLGGEMDDKGNCYDAFAIDMIRRLRFDKCFITSACISANFGLSIQKSQAISFWNAVIDSSRESIGLYPTEKIGAESIVSICPVSRLDKLITDSDASEDDLLAFDGQGVEIFIAGSDTL